MYNVILNILLLFVPFLYLFFLGVEIYVNKPRNKINRLAMLLMFSCAVFFSANSGWIHSLLMISYM